MTQNDRGSERGRAARQWLLNGGGGHEDGEDGLRALTVTGSGLIDFLAAYDEYLRQRYFDAAKKMAAREANTAVKNACYKDAALLSWLRNGGLGAIILALEPK